MKNDEHKESDKFPDPCGSDWFEIDPPDCIDWMIVLIAVTTIAAVSVVAWIFTL